jgi:hypothetical protein
MVAPDPDAGQPSDAGTSAAGVPFGAEEIATTDFGTAPVTDSVNVYWGVSENLMFAPLTGGAAKVLATEPSGDDINSIVPAAGSVYWSAFPFIGNCGEVYVSSTAGATSTVVPRVAAGLVAVTSSFLYLMGGEVLRVAR